MSDTNTTPAGHIYVVELAPAVCKVGRSAHRFNRLAAYATERQGLLAWSSPRITGYRGAETHLIHSLAARHPQLPGTKETFRVGFREAVDVARRIVAELDLAGAAA